MITTRHTLKTDMKGALDIGLTTIWVNSKKEQVAEIKPDYELTKLSDLFKILN